MVGVPLLGEGIGHIEIAVHLIIGYADGTPKREPRLGIELHVGLDERVEVPEIGYVAGPCAARPARGEVSDAGGIEAFGGLDMASHCRLGVGRLPESLPDITPRPILEFGGDAPNFGPLDGGENVHIRLDRREELGHLSPRVGLHRRKPRQHAAQLGGLDDAIHRMPQLDGEMGLGTGPRRRHESEREDQHGANNPSKHIFCHCFSFSRNLG